MSERHPDEHEPLLQQRLEESTHSELLIPCENARVAKAIKSRLNSLARAHRKHKTPKADAYRHMNARVYHTSDVKRSRPGWNPGPEFPITLILDSRERYKENLALAVPSEGSEEVLRAPQTEHPEFLETLDEDSYEENDAVDAALRGIISGIGEQPE